MAVRNLEAVQQLSGPAVRAESRPGRIGPISLGAKQTGERRAGNPHAAFDVAGAGNVAWSRCCDTRRRKGERLKQIAAMELQREELLMKLGAA